MSLNFLILFYYKTLKLNLNDILSHQMTNDAISFSEYFTSHAKDVTLFS